MTAAPPTCGICGTRCRPPFRAPAAELAPDLDGRPGEPARSTLERWVALCPSCGAAAPDLAALPASAAPIVRRDDYVAEPDRFLRWSILAAETGDPAAAAEAVLQAAWHQEDRGPEHAETAAALRRRAAAIWTGDPLRQIDILRRAGALAEAEALVAGLTCLDEDQRRILDFQRARIAAGDTARYAISSALRPPARTPHVTHGQRAPMGRSGDKPGLFSRLFGR